MISTGSLICGQRRPVQSRPLLGLRRDVLTWHTQRAQQRVQRLPRLHRRLVIAVQVDEQHPAAEPARLPGGVPRLDRQRGLAHPRQARHRRHHHRRRVPAGSSSAAICASSSSRPVNPVTSGGSCASATGAAAA